MMKALVVVAITCAIVAAWGFYWAKREREGWRPRHRP
jgi:nitrogen fixation-related uncharacterized protein